MFSIIINIMPKVSKEDKKLKKIKGAEKGMSTPAVEPVAELPEEELEIVEVVEEITINNPKSKKHGKKVKRVVKEIKDNFEWLEVDHSKLTDSDLDDLDLEAEKHPPADLGMDFMLQLIARGSTVETAKKKWRMVCKELKTDKDLIKLMKKV